jgi:hypothetical protein
VVASMIANWSPTHLRGPPLRGMYLRKRKRCCGRLLEVFTLCGKSNQGRQQANLPVQPAGRDKAPRWLAAARGQPVAIPSSRAGPLCPHEPRLA